MCAEEEVNVALSGKWWGVVGEPLADRMKVKHWPTVVSHSWSQLVALRQGPGLLTKLIPLTCPISACFTWIFLEPSQVLRDVHVLLIQMFTFVTTLQLCSAFQIDHVVFSCEVRFLEAEAANF